MSMAIAPILAFNRGIIDARALSRTDLDKTALSAEEQLNWIPRVLGSMMLRPGFEYILGQYNDAKAIGIPFVFSNTDTALIELTDGKMRVIVDDAAVSRVSVSTAITSGDFSSATGWTDSDESGATSTITGGKLELVGSGFAAAIREQLVTVAVGDQNDQHALNIIVDRGPVTLRVGSTSGGDEYISETALGTGYHSLTFTPTGNFYVRFFSTRVAKTIVDSCTVASAGAMVIDTPWTEALLPSVRYDQSADVIFLACNGLQQRRIERRTTTSWSLILYEPEDGPFRVANSGNTQMTPSGRTGDITLTASRSYFTSGNVGGLFRIESSSQVVSATVTGANQFTDDIRITGVDTQRKFSISITGTFTATITLQRSIGETGAWFDIDNYTVPTSIDANDGLDNQIVFHRLICKTGNYTSGTAVITLTYGSGSRTGIMRITGYTSGTQVSAAVLSPLGDTNATTSWAEGEWSDRRGWPSAVGFHEGRLGWAGRSKIILSESDAYDRFSDETEGDSKFISRTIGSGPVDVIRGILSLQSLVLLAEGAEWSARASTLDEILTPSNFNLRAPSTQGSANVMPIKVDDRGLMVERSGIKLYQISNEGDVNYQYSTIDMMRFVPDLCNVGIARIAAHRQPDTRIHCVLNDGTVALLVNQPVDEVTCWVKVETDGIVEEVVVLPGDIEDKVYYSVKRTINGATKRYWERWAREDECIGATLNKQADSFKIYSGAATNTISGLSHLEGEEVVVWGNGIDLSPYNSLDDASKTYTVTSGVVTLDSGVTVTSAVVGLPYEARYKSSKMAYGSNFGSALTMPKYIRSLGLNMVNTHNKGLWYGLDFDNMYDLPRIEGGTTFSENTVWPYYDNRQFEFPMEISTDSRLCLRAMAPRPITIAAALAEVETYG